MKQSKTKLRTCICALCFRALKRRSGRLSSQVLETYPDPRAILAVASLSWLPASRSALKHARFKCGIRMVCYSFFPSVIQSWYEQDIHTERKATRFYPSKVAEVNGRWVCDLENFGLATDVGECAWVISFWCTKQNLHACTHVDGIIRKPRKSNFGQIVPRWLISPPIWCKMFRDQLCTGAEVWGLHTNSAFPYLRGFGVVHGADFMITRRARRVDTKNSSSVSLMRQCLRAKNVGSISLRNAILSSRQGLASMRFVRRTAFIGRTW